jgi:hypothetical protein
MTTFEDKLGVMSSEMNKLKGMQGEFSKKLILDLKKTDMNNEMMKKELERHIDDYKSQQMNLNFNQDKNEMGIK